MLCIQLHSAQYCHSIDYSFYLSLLTIFIALDHSIGLQTFTLFFGLRSRNHSVGSMIMPVTTRSMTKRDLQCSSDPATFFHHPTCVVDTTKHRTTSLNVETESTLPLPELIAPCSSSDSLSERDDS